VKATGALLEAGLAFPNDRERVSLDRSGAVRRLSGKDGLTNLASIT